MSAKEIILHEAKQVINWDGYVYDKSVLKELEVGYIVRLSMILKSPARGQWSHASPYVSISKCDKDNDSFLGEVKDINRVDDDCLYPIRTGDRLWFSSNNIIEIPVCWNSKNKKKVLEKHILPHKVNVTGPLYTIIYPAESDSDSDNSCDSYSDDTE